jgi:hypothetical protein
MRSLNEIAREIVKDWTKPYFAAKPHLNAMLSLDSINDMYYMDSAKEVVIKFLCNASTWRGDKAREIKKELKEMSK